MKVLFTLLVSLTSLGVSAQEECPLFEGSYYENACPTDQAQVAYLKINQGGASTSVCSE